MSSKEQEPSGKKQFEPPEIFNSLARDSDSSHSTPSPNLPYSLKPSSYLSAGEHWNLRSSIAPTPLSTVQAGRSHLVGGEKKKSHQRQPPPGHIPRPRNAFIIFRCDFALNKRVTAVVEHDHRNISRIAGQVWREMQLAEKEKWEALADLEAEEHRKKYPNYRYHRGKKSDAFVTGVEVKKRRHAKKTSPVSEQDLARFKEVASLVNDGCEGAELENEMKARVYRRSRTSNLKALSALTPVPDEKPSLPTFPLDSVVVQQPKPSYPSNSPESIVLRNFSTPMSSSSTGCYSTYASSLSSLEQTQIYCPDPTFPVSLTDTDAVTQWAWINGISTWREVNATAHIPRVNTYLNDQYIPQAYDLKGTLSSHRSYGSEASVASVSPEQPIYLHDFEQNLLDVPSKFGMQPSQGNIYADSKDHGRYKQVSADFGDFFNISSN